jgi:hypothetical protein
MIISPVLFDDDWIYSANEREVIYTFESRRKLCTDNSMNFNKTYVQQRGWHVGLVNYRATDERDTANDSKSNRILSAWQKLSTERVLFACAATKLYPSDADQGQLDETQFSPKLVGKVPMTPEGLRAISASTISIYDHGYLAIDRALNAALLQLSEGYGLLAGKKLFVEEAIGCSIRESWKIINTDGMFSQYSMDAFMLNPHML